MLIVLGVGLSSAPTKVTPMRLTPHFSGELIIIMVSEIIFENTTSLAFQAGVFGVFFPLISIFQ